MAFKKQGGAQDAPPDEPQKETKAEVEEPAKVEASAPAVPAKPEAPKPAAPALAQGFVRCRVVSEKQGVLARGMFYTFGQEFVHYEAEAKALEERGTIVIL